MKTIKLIFYILIVSAWTSCSSGDASENPENIDVKLGGFLKIDTLSVDLDKAYIEDYGAFGNSYNLDFTAMSAITSKQKAVVYFELFSSVAEDLSEGTYRMGTYTSATPATFTKWAQSMLGSYLKVEQKGLAVINGVSIRPDSGVFTVEESGERYQVSFVGRGTAKHFIDGEMISKADNVPFSMEYVGLVERHEGVVGYSKLFPYKRPVKMRRVIF
ncbi:MAG: hypothetical protein ACK5L5_08945 [Bacteroidales bacterium]